MLRVLIVDDESLLTFLLRAELEARGCEVVGTAAHGLAAVEFCRANLPEVVLMDIRMPVMDGLEATRIIMAENPTCIIVMTAYEDATTAARAEAAGAMAYLTKPLSADEILAAVRPAQARLAEFLSVRTEASGLEDALEARRVVEAAKKVVGGHVGAVTGGEFGTLQRLAAEKGASLRAIAEEIAAGAARGEGAGTD